MSKKKLKKLTVKEYCLGDRDDKNCEDTRSCNHAMKRETEFKRFKIEKDGREKKRNRSSDSSHDTDRRSQEKIPNRSKTNDNFLIQTEKQKKIVIKFKAKEIKHGKSTRTPDVATTSSESWSKSCFEGTESKRALHSFAVQRDKALKKKKEKAELCKLKVEQTMLEKFKSPVHDLHVPHRTSDGSKKQSKDDKIPKMPPDTSTRTAHDNRPFTKKPNTTSRTWEEAYEEKYKELSEKKQHVNKHAPSCSSAPALQRQHSCKWKKQDPDSDKAPGNSETEERDLEATALCFKQNAEVPCTSDSYQGGKVIKPAQKSCEIFPPPQGSQTAETDQEMQIAEDLHVARIQKRIALPVVQTCGELTSMEIDPPEQDLNVSAEACTSGLNMLVVLDTNIMISHLEFVISLKAEDIPGVGRLALIIPWVVLQELDNLKKGKMLQRVWDKAIPAVQFIYKCLKNQDPKLWGQSMQLACQKMYGLSCENNDDRVLQCCLQYQNLFPQAVVILCTNDKNLCNKAIVSNIKAFCKADLVIALQNLNVNKHQKCDELQLSKCDTELEKTEGGSAAPTGQFPNTLPDLEKNLGEALSCILETEMKIAFGNLWMEVKSLHCEYVIQEIIPSCVRQCRGTVVAGSPSPSEVMFLGTRCMKLFSATLVMMQIENNKGVNNKLQTLSLSKILYLKPPWTLANLLKCYRKHWVAVFGCIVPRNLLSAIDCLYNHLCTGCPLDSSTMHLLLQESKALFHAFSSRSDYNGVLPRAYAEVTKLFQTLEEVRSDSEQDLPEDVTVFPETAGCEKMEAVTPSQQNSEETKLESSFHVPQGNRHQEIWSVLEGLWNTINSYSNEIFQKLDLNALTTTGRSSFEEAFLGLQKLLAAVNDIHGGISRILTPTSSFQDIWTLYDFLTSNEINNSIKFTAEELYACVSEETYRKRLEVGCCQLAQLELTIKQCHAVVHTEAKSRGWL